jgi:peptidyl-prolyl cis-trans isomerase SurA
MICLKKLNKVSLKLSLFLLLIIVPLSAHAMVFDRVVAKVNSEIITLSFVEERAGLLRQKYANALEKPSGQDILKEALNMIVDEKLQLQEAKKIGFIIDEDAVDNAVEEIKKRNNIAEEQLEEMLEREGRTLNSYKDHIRDQIMVSKITRFEINNRVKVSDKKIVKYYNEHKKEQWRDGKVKARHILFIAERGSSDKARREKLLQAKAVLRELQRGDDFADLAMEHSEDVSASSGGDLGYVERGKMVPEFEKVVFSLKAGQVSDIVETQYGYHIIKAEEVLPGKTLTFSETKDRIYQILAMQKQEQVYKDWMNELKETAFIEVTLFEGSVQDEGLVSREFEKKDNNAPARKRKLKSSVDSSKRDLQKTWEEMYKSVEKSKRDSQLDDDSQEDSLEQKLKHIKNLRNQKRISEKEYQKRKGRLLKNL